MARLNLEVGSNANDGTGDTLRAAMIKVNTNFTELYASPLISSGITVAGNEIRANRSNDDLVFTPSGTGSILFPAIRINDNNIEGVRSNEDINIIPAGTGSVQFGALSFAGNNITGTRSNENINLIPSGSGGVVIGALSFSANNITGTRSNEDINLIPAGTGDVVLSALRVNGTTLNSSDSGKITIAEAVDVTGALMAGALVFSAGGATVTGTLDEDNMASDSAVKLATQQSIKKYVDDKATAEDLDFQGDSGGALSIDLDSETLTIAGGTNITTTGSGNTLTIALDSALSGFASVGVGSLTLAGNDITSSSNADINITPGGTGTIVIGDLTIDSNISIADNIIKATASNSDLELSASGSGTVNVASGLITAAVTTVGNWGVTGTQTITGQLDVDYVRIKDNVISTNASNANLIISGSSSGNVVIDDVDIGGGAIDNTVIGATTPLAGTFTALTSSGAVTIDSNININGNEIKTTASNANLELAGNGSGGVKISGFTFPTSDGSSGQFIKTDGLGTLSFATAGATLNHSDIADATTTVASSATTVMNTFPHATYRSAKYFISITTADESRYEILEANVTHNGSDAFISTFGSVSNYGGSGGLATFTAAISGSNVEVRVTNITADSTVFKFQRIALDV